MKAIRIKETTGFNPAFSAKEASRARHAKTEYNIPCILKYEVGTEATGDGIVVQCILPQPTMRPADKECHEAVVQYLSHPARREHMEKLQRMSEPTVLNSLPAGLRKYVESVNAKWADSPTASVVLGETEIEPLIEEEVGQEDE